MSFSSPEFWLALLNIIFINMILSGDNAVVIGLTANQLPANLRNKAIIWGGVAAVAMRVILTVVAVYLLKVPFLTAIGAVLLLKIAADLLLGGSDHDAKTASTLKEAIRTIMIADLIMSLDNVLAIAAAAKGNMALLICGLVIGIPIVMLGSKMISLALEKFPWLAYVGSGILAYTAGEMFASDHIINKAIDLERYGKFIGIVLAVLLVAFCYYKNAKAAKTSGKDQNQAA